MLTRQIHFVLVLLLAVTALASGRPATAGAQPVAPHAPDPPQSTSALRAAASAGPVSGSRTGLVITVALKASTHNQVPKTVPDETPSALAHDVIEASRPWFGRVSHGVFGGYFALSRGPVTVETTVTPVCTDKWLAEVADKADAAIRDREPSLDPRKYGVVVYYFGKVQACTDPHEGAPDGAAGIALGNRVWLNGDHSIRVALHELGHNLGLGHSGSESCTDGLGQPVPLDSNPANCLEQEYGDPYSSMGLDLSGAYSPSQLAQLGWNDGHVTTASASSATTHYVLTTADVNGTTALRLLDGNTTLWLEYRGVADFDGGNLDHGLLIRRELPSRAGSPFLLTMNKPGGPFLNIPHPSMIVGQTWADPLGTMQITLDSADQNGANVTIRPSITLKTVPGLLGRKPAAANNAIAAAGLAVGIVGTKVDPLCEDIGNVITQTPAAGTSVPAGSRVDYQYGVQPSNGCPIEP